MTIPWTMIFEVAFDTDPGSEPGVWTDLSARLRDNGPISISSGAGRLSSSTQGSCRVTLDNADRMIDPLNPSATYNLVPMRHARLRVTVGATTYPLFRGLVDAWPPVMSSHDSTVDVELVDGFAWLATQDADLDLPEQLSSDRVTALLDLADWPAGLRDIGTGVKTLEAYEQNSANLLRSLQDVADAEGGDLYIAPDGKVTFRSRHARFDQTPVITLGTGGVGILSASPAYDTSWLTNIGRVELESGDVYETIDDASVTAYGPRVLPIRDLALSAAEAEGTAQWEVLRFAEPLIWIDALRLNGRASGALAAILPRRIGDLVTVVHDTPAIDMDLCIERVRHEISAAFWTIWLDLSPYFGAGPWFELDHDTYGLPNDTNKLSP